MVSNAIKTRIDEAVKFSEDYPEALRPAIVGHLLSSPSGVGKLVSTGLDREAERAQEKEVPIKGSASHRAAASLPKELGSEEEIDWFSKLAEELGVPSERLRDIYEVTDDGSPRVRVILQHDSLPKRQIGYTLLHLIAYEKAGKQGATSDELRLLVQAKKAYDTGNFTRNFKTTNKVRAYGNPGQADTEWVLTGPGREEGRRLIKELCSAELP